MTNYTRTVPPSNLSSVTSSVIPKSFRSGKITLPVLEREVVVVTADQLRKPAHMQVSSLLVGGEPGTNHSAWRGCKKHSSAAISLAAGRTFLLPPSVVLLSSTALRRSHRAHRCMHIFAGPRADISEPWWEKNNPENMKAVNSVQDFVDELADSGDNLVIVDFYAKWCHACRSLFPKLCQICRDNPDLKVLKVDWDENKDVAKTLGVKVLPFFQLYRGAEGKVAEFSCSVAKVQRLRDAIEANHAARCSLGLNPTLREYFPNNKPTHNMDRHEITILDNTGDHVISQSMASFDGDLESQGRAPQAVA